ncbi:MAG: hypothetical protein J6Q22_17255 [Prevotella sp.]|nr:hypothetical protein [Prevotella sp.]
MKFIEDYKNLFDLVADLPEDDPCGSYNSLMRPVELKETAEYKKFNGGDEDKPASASFIETEEKKNFKEVKPSKETALKPKVSGAAEVMKKNGVVTDVDMPEGLKEKVKEEITKIRNDASDEKSWDKKANQVKNMFNNNVSKVAKPRQTRNIINAVTDPTTEEKKFPKIKNNPEFLKVKDIQPVTKVKVEKMKAVNNNTVGYDELDIPVNTKFICDDWDDNADEAIQKFRDRVEKMKGMSKYTKEYKNRCANLLYKYKDLPKKQFESLCNIMESVNA